MTALPTGASLTWYHSRYPAFDGAKVQQKKQPYKNMTAISGRYAYFGNKRK